jgi:mannose-6-phosphate isomerase-like protein (cupin superfamily)
MIEYINRHIKKPFLKASSEYPALLLTGSRQTGKTTMLKRLMLDEKKRKRTYVSLDDYDALTLASGDPVMFFQTYKPPLLIDEVQYAPGLFTGIKRLIDKGANPGDFWMTGSQLFKMMKKYKRKGQEGGTMLVKRHEMKTEVREKMSGGEGKAELIHLVDCQNEKNIRMLAELTLRPGCSIGSHGHENETEYYVILSGEGVVNDNGTEKPVKEGDVIVTGNGASHSIRNNGSVPLVFYAVIVTY